MDSLELGGYLPGATKRNLERQKFCRVLELRADGGRREIELRMRGVMALIAEAVAVPRVKEAIKPRGPGARKAHNALHPRDLRKIDNSHPTNCKNPAIVVRHSVIVANFDPLRVVVLHDPAGVASLAKSPSSFPPRGTCA